MSSIIIGTMILTGPTGGLGKELALQVARRPANDRPDMLLVGRPGQNLTEITRLTRESGANAYEIACDLSRLSDVRARQRKLFKTSLQVIRCVRCMPSLQMPVWVQLIPEKCQPMDMN